MEIILHLTYMAAVSVAEELLQQTCAHLQAVIGVSERFDAGIDIVLPVLVCLHLAAPGATGAASKADASTVHGVPPASQRNQPTPAHQ